jgi:hypothetical protein
MSLHNDKLYKKEAEQILKDLDQDPNQDVGSIIVILMIISIIVGIIRIIQGCKKNRKVNLSQIVDMSLLPEGNRLIDRAIKRALTKQQYQAHGQKIKDLIIKRGKSIEISSLQNMIDIAERE